MGVVLCGLAACADTPPPPQQTAAAGCAREGRIIPPDPVFGCGAPPPKLAEHETCPVPVPTEDAQHKALPGVTLARNAPGPRNFPVYPEAYANNMHEGIVAARCVVTEEGRTCGCQILTKDADPYFKLSMLDWLAALRLQPATRNGLPVASEKSWAVTFFPPQNLKH